MLRPSLLAFIAPLLLAASLLDGAQLSYHTTAPSPGADDIFNLVGATRDRDNVGGDGLADGGANDASTYLSGSDRPHQGQTFRTGAHPAGYRAAAVWLRHPGYTANTSSTWWRTPVGGSLGVRVTEPAAAGTPSFALRSESLVTTGAETGAPNSLAPVAAATNTATGTGVWLRFAFATPVTLAADTLYGFDVTATSANFFLETLGVRDAAAPGGDAYPAGSAYRGSTNGAPDDSLQALAGDRVFLVELIQADAAPPDDPDAPLPAPLHAASPFPLERVRLLESRFKTNQDLHRTGYLAWISPDRLLHPFRANAGLPQPAGATHLGGWEGDSGFTAVRGHMAGHYLTAAAKMYAATGDASFLPKIDYLVAELKKCQDALGAQEVAAGRVAGYLSAFPVSYFDTLETNPGSAQVPFYTIHKILAGLVDAHRHTGNAQALDVAIAMADYHRWRVDRLTASQIEAMFRTDNGNSEEWGGMNEALADLYQLSRARGDAAPDRHLAFARLFHRDWFIAPLLAGQDQLAGLHANTHVPGVTGFARVASFLPETAAERARLYSAADGFRRLVLERHWLVLGGNSYREHFAAGGVETGPGGSALNVATAETCNTHNMLRLVAELFQHEPSAPLADYFEHALYNHILASLAPDTGMPTYFVPMVSGHFKTYSRPEGSCWCCTGTGIENTARYNAGIYFHHDDTLWVNLFVPSTLDWSERGLGVRLETAFPESDTIRLTLSAAAPASAKLRLRIPAWIAGPPTLSVNGVVQSVPAAAGSYAELERVWQNGDVVTLVLPLGLRLDRSMDDPDQVSLFHGPVLLAGDLGSASMPASDQAAGQLDYQNHPRVSAPVLIAPSAEDLDLWVRPAGAPLHYLADTAKPGLAARGQTLLRPFYDTHHTRYAVYWNLAAPLAVSTWTGAAATGAWSETANWDAPPAASSALSFDSAAGGAALNDLTTGAPARGIEIAPSAGPFAISGDTLPLRGDILDFSPHRQRIDLSLALLDSLPWRFLVSTGELVIGGGVGGSGMLEKTGAGTLTLESTADFSGSILVSAGSLRLGAGAGLGPLPVELAAGAALLVDRAEPLDLAAPLSGAGDLVKRGQGELRLFAPAAHSGATRVEAGSLRVATRARQVLAHRWSFDGDLSDSVGGAHAVLVDLGANDATLSSGALTLAGGAKESSDYVSLGSGLLPKDGRPLTLEFWATQQTLRAWSRIFDVGRSTTENLFMSWSRQSLGTDRVEWKDGATATADDTSAPFALGVEHHIVLVVEPGAGSEGRTRLTWYAAPSASATLGAARGTLETADTLAALDDTNFWLGRSHYADPTASAAYNEVRLWTRAFSAAELQSLHLLGPGSVGDFAQVFEQGALSPTGALALLAAAELDLGGTAQTVASLAAAPGSVLRLGSGGRATVGGGAGADPDATFAGSLLGSGELRNDGVLRLVGDATLSPDVTLRNRGTLDIMTWRGSLPAGFVNEGVLLDRGAVRIDSTALRSAAFELTLHGYRGHRYQLQHRADLAAGEWLAIGPPRAGEDAAITFAHEQPEGTSAPRRFYRVVVDP